MNDSVCKSVDPVVVESAEVIRCGRLARPRRAAGWWLAAGLLSAAPIAGWAQAAAPIVGKAEDAKNKVSMCVGCHEIPGYKASFPSVYRVPMLYGQNAKYIENALTSYRKGDRNHPTMKAIAASLSDQDIADLAAYYGAK